MGEDDWDFFGELDELESGDSVTPEQVSSSGGAQSLPFDSGVDRGGDEEGVSLSEEETSLHETSLLAPLEQDLLVAPTCATITLSIPTSTVKRCVKRTVLRNALVENNTIASKRSNRKR